MLQIDHLSFSYGTTEILNDLSFSLEEGHVLALLGKNGVGKSTLLRLLAGILKPTSGNITLENRPLTGYSPRALSEKVAYLPQSPPSGSTTVFDTLLIALQPQNPFTESKKDLDTVSDLLEQMDLSLLTLRPLSSLSGGERQKVAIASALVRSPSLFLFDEPTASLDLKAALDTADLIADLAKTQGKTVIVSIHDLNLALRIANTFLFLHEGRIISICSRESITPEIIKTVYGASVSILKDTPHPIIIPN